MPIIKSAKKRAKQSIVRQARNYNVRTAVRKAMRAVMDAVKGGDKAAAEKLIPNAYKQIDMAQKKNVLKKNTAARRKSLIARTVAGVGTEKAEVPVAKKKTAKAKPAKKA